MIRKHKARGKIICSSKEGKKEKKERKNEDVPELEFGKTTDEGTKLIGSSGRERGPIGEVLDLGVHLRREKADEEVEDVDPEAIGDDVEPLDEVDADDVDESHG